MTTGKTISIKSLLRAECLPGLTARQKYFSLPSVSKWLIARKLACPPETLARYLHQFTTDGIIYGAGRGWYSSLSQPFVLEREPVSSLVQKLKQTFPLLSCSCWSTEQLRSYGHHLLARFVTFVHTDRDAMSSVSDSLKSHGYDLYLNPRGQLLRGFSIGERTVVVRPRVTTQPAEGGFATIEAILVDLFVEAKPLHLLDEDEYFRTFDNLAGSARISIGSLVKYAKKRKPATANLLNQLSDDFLKIST
jgi:hypothetical protein